MKHKNECLSIEERVKRLEEKEEEPKVVISSQRMVYDCRGNGHVVTVGGNNGGY